MGKTIYDVEVFRKYFCLPVCIHIGYRNIGKIITCRIRYKYKILQGLPISSIKYGYGVVYIIRAARFPDAQRFFAEYIHNTVTIDVAYNESRRPITTICY